MFISAYVFALVLGSVLLGASFLMGGNHDHDADAHVEFDAHADFDVDAHADFDVDADADLDGDMDAHADAGHDTHGDVIGFFGVLGSVRFWTFFAAFFGLTGLVMDGLDLAGELTSLGLAIGVGALTGWTAVTVIRSLAANDTGVAAGVNDYVGKSGEVLLAAGPGKLGKVRIELKGTTVDVLAESEEPLAKGEQALIVEMRDDHKAVVVRLDSASRPAIHA